MSSPSDHARLIAELLQPLGPELARRWLGALLLVDRADREAMVEMVEQRIAELYPANPKRKRAEMILVRPPEIREGYVEQVRVDYRADETPRGAPGQTKARRAGR